MDHKTPLDARGLSWALHRFLESAGGFTLHHRTGQPASNGVSVCADPDASISFPWHEWDDELVRRWVARCTERLRGSDLHLGGWLDPDTQRVWLDVVRVYPADCRREAVDLGHAHRQKAVFDLGEGEVLAVQARSEPAA